MTERKKARYRYTRSTHAAMHAALQGFIARRRGKGITENPYDPDGDAYQKAMAEYWVKGWPRTTPEK